MHVAFAGSVFKASTFMFAILYILVIVSYTTQQIMYIMYGNGKLITLYQDQYTSQTDTDILHSYFIHFCANSSPIWVLIFSAIWDLFMSSLLCGLFVHKLFKAFIAIERHNKKFVLKELYKIARYITVTIVDVTTTSVTLIIFGLTSWFILMSIDLIINSWCVFLMYRKNRRSFKRLCGICHKCVGRITFWCFQCMNVVEYTNEVKNVANSSNAINLKSSTKPNAKVNERKDQFLNVYAAHWESSASVMSMRKTECKHQKLPLDDTDDEETETMATTTPISAIYSPNTILETNGCERSSESESVESEFVDIAKKEGITLIEDVNMDTDGGDGDGELTITETDITAMGRQARYTDSFVIEKSDDEMINVVIERVYTNDAIPIERTD